MREWAKLAQEILSVVDRVIERLRQWGLQARFAYRAAHGRPVRPYVAELPKRLARFIPDW
jgi:hypothetical protein